MTAIDIRMNVVAQVEKCETADELLKMAVKSQLEIAAQLAELNERIGKIFLSNSPYPRLVIEKLE